MFINSHGWIYINLRILLQCLIFEYTKGLIFYKGYYMKQNSQFDGFLFDALAIKNVHFSPWPTNRVIRVFSVLFDKLLFSVFSVTFTLLDIVLNIWLDLEKRYYLGGTFICDFRTVDGLSLGSSDKDIKCHHLTFYYSSSPLYYFSALNTTPTSHIWLCQRSLFPELKKYVYICM